MAQASAATRNTTPAEGGPSGGNLEGRVGAFYLLCMLTETEPRGLAGARATRVKFQRGYEGHAFDDIIVEAVNAAGEPVVLEIQAKRTLDFTASDVPFGKLVGQIVSATEEAAGRPIAAAVSRTNTKIERHYHQLLVAARRVGSGAALRRALDAPRVVTGGMRDFAAAFAAHLRAAGADDSDEALWRILRRFQILVFDFESPGAASSLLALALARLALPPTARDRAADLWSALQEKALSYDADAGELDRAELVEWLRKERGIAVVPRSDMVTARRRLSDHSRAALEAIDDRIANIALDRSHRLDAVATALEKVRYVELVGASGVGKSALLKALVETLGPEAFPLVLSPARTPGGGWLSLSRDLGFDGSALDFLSELAASGATTVFIDGLDRFTDPATQATVIDLLQAASRVADLRVVATVAPDFDEDQRLWLPGAALALLGRDAVVVGPLTDDEAAALAAADARLRQLLTNSDAKPLTRNLYQLRQLLNRAGAGDLPLTEATLAQTWWEASPNLSRPQQRERLRALRVLGGQVLAQAARLDITDVASPVVEDLLRGDDLVELIGGAAAAFKHDVLRDWSAANLLREDAAAFDRLPLHELAPVGLARGLELHARSLIEGDPTGAAWSGLVERLRTDGVHASWLRLALLALVRSERGVTVLDRAFDALSDNQGELLQALIRHTIAIDSVAAADRFAAVGVPRELIPDGMRLPAGLSWMRLMIWLLERGDRLTVPIGPDILHFFSAWLMAYAAGDLLRPRIVQRLYDWLMVLEAMSEAQEPVSNFSQLFASDRRGGFGREVCREVRMLFLNFCDQSPQLAAAYLNRHMTQDTRYDLSGDILKFSQGVAKAAPGALAAFTVEALIDAERRDQRASYGGRRDRLALHTDLWVIPGPTKGPFLAVLRADRAEGLSLVRKVVDYGLGLDDLDPTGLEGFTLDLPGGPLRVVAPGTYFMSRDMGGAPAVTSALRALEAWGHEQIQAGRPVAEVVDDILGETGVSAAFLAVAVDALLSHTATADPLLVPFLSSPELLKLDWDRSNRDRIGLDQFEDAEPESLPGAASNAGLRAQSSRRTALNWQLGPFLFQGAFETAEQIRDALRRGQARLSQVSPDAEETARSPRWHADHALRLLDPVNWRPVEVEQNLRTATAYEYVEPPEEFALLEPLRTASYDQLSETAVMSLLVTAVVTADRRSPDLLDRGLMWAQAQPWSQLREDAGDFEEAQRWRAVVAAATLTALSAERPDALPWSRSVLARAVALPSSERAYHVQYHALALAAVGCAALAAAGEIDARDALLELAGRDSETVTKALGSMFDHLSTAEPRLPKAMLRVGLTAALQAERSWKDVAVTARRQAKRDRRLKAAIAAEAAWLAGGAEPAWPKLPSPRRAPRRRGIRLPGGPSFAKPDERPAEPRPDLWFDDHSGGGWLSAAELSKQVRESPWIADLVAAYRDFSDAAWGLGLDEIAEADNLPTRWLHPFDRLRLRASLDRDAATYEATVLEPLTALPDQAFLTASEVLVGALDSLFWDEKRLPIEWLVDARQRIIDRVMACSLWRWGRTEKTDTISMDLAGPLQALFLIDGNILGVGACYLPANGAAFGPIFAGLLKLTRDAPGRSYVATLFLSLLERGQAWVSIDIVLSAAEAWADARSIDAEFWRDQAFGRRLCVLLDAQIGRLRESGPDAVARTRRLVEHLILAGVPEGLLLEQRLVGGF